MSQKLKATTYEYLDTSDIKFSGSIEPRVKLLNIVTNVPKTKSRVAMAGLSVTRRQSYG